MQAPNIKKLLKKAVHSPGLWAALFVLVVGVSYFPAASGPFFFDDEHFILKNQMVHSLANAGEIYKSSVTQGSAIKGNFYRPNQQMLFALIYQLAGVSTPVPYHLASMMIHTLNGVLFQAWLMMLGVAAPAAGLMALLFLVHPAQTEAVSYISGLADPLALLFIFGGLLWYGKALKRRGATPFVLGIVPALVWLCLALLCKENAVVFAPMALASSVMIAVRREAKVTKGEWVGLGAIGAVVLVYIGLKLTVLKFGDAAGLTEDDNDYTRSLAMRLTTFVSVLWDYAVLLFFPKDLFYEKPYIAYATLVTPRGAFGIALLGALGFAVSRVRSHPELALGAFLFLAGLLPYTGVLPLNAMLLEHWLYLPMLGFAVMVVYGLTKVPKVGQLRSAAWTTFALLLMACMARTHVRNVDWADIESFYLNELAHGGQSTRIYNNLGMYYADRNDLQKSITYYKLAMQATGAMPYPQPHHNLARAYASAGKLPEAVEELRQALAIDPNFIYSLNFLHEIFLAVKDERRAQLCAQAMQLVQNGQAYDVAAFNREIFGP